MWVPYVRSYLPSSPNIYILTWRKQNHLLSKCILLLHASSNRHNQHNAPPTFPPRRDSPAHHGAAGRNQHTISTQNEPHFPTVILLSLLPRPTQPGAHQHTTAQQDPVFPLGQTEPRHRGRGAYSAIRTLLGTRSQETLPRLQSSRRGINRVPTHAKQKPCEQVPVTHRLRSLPPDDVLFVSAKTALDGCHSNLHRSRGPCATERIPRHRLGRFGGSGARSREERPGQ